MHRAHAIQQRLVAGALVLAAQRRMLAAVRTGAIRPLALRPLLRAAMPPTLRLEAVSLLAVPPLPLRVQPQALFLAQLVSQVGPGGRG